MTPAESSSSRPRAETWGAVSRLFHWLTALLVFLMIPAGIAMTSSGFESISNQLFVFHKGTGAVLLVLVVARLGWRLVVGPPRPHPRMTPAQARLADRTHILLYLLLLGMTLSGYVRVIGGGFPIELLDALGIPPLLPEMESVAERASVVHKFLAYALVAVVAGHVAAAVQHAVVNGSPILGRMDPRGWRKD
jgi:cytochrome b561